MITSRTTCEIRSIEAPDIVLMSLFLTLDIFDTFSNVFFADFGLANIRWNTLLP